MRVLPDTAKEVRVGPIEAVNEHLEPGKPRTALILKC